MGITTKDEQGIQGMRTAGRLAAEVLDYLTPHIKPGITTREIDRLAALPPETVVYPGHGPSTTIGAERATNPFLNGSMRLVRG